MAFLESPAEWLVRTSGLSRIYGDGTKIRALDGVDLLVAPGELVAVMGPSGSGKSTLLNIIGALDRQDEGEIFINGTNLRDVTDLDAFRSRMVGFVFQLHNLLPTLTALENVEVPMVGVIGKKERRLKAIELLELVGLSDRSQHLPAQLSGGQRQRVAIARSLANSPSLILADEPTGALDTSSGKELMKLLRLLNHNQGVTIIVVTHDLTVARQTNRVIYMLDGKITREDRIGTPLEEDLKLWRQSGLGQKILGGDEASLAELKMTGIQVKTIRGFLEEKS
jgi:ABC-type lipoprotein export system ATPase subunit